MEDMREILKVKDEVIKNIRADYDVEIKDLFDAYKPFRVFTFRVDNICKKPLRVDLREYIGEDLKYVYNNLYIGLVKYFELE